MPATYGKRTANKRRQAPTISDDDDSVSPTNTPSKRRRVSPEPADQHIAVPDLSDIFRPIRSSSSTATPQGSPAKKRMLGRSRTESSIESQSPTQSIDRTPSLPIISSSPQPRPAHSALPSSSKRATTRTYAGNFRSFLVTLPSSSSTSIPADDDEAENRESYSSLRLRWGVDNSEDDPNPFDPMPSPTKSTSTSDASPSRRGKAKAKLPAPPVSGAIMNNLKSISELRNKGEGRRFLDEAGYLFEGLDPKGSLALRRASALEITIKLCDEDFTRKAKAADFFSQTLDLFIVAGAGRQEDKILDLLLVVFLALVARDPASLAELSERSVSLHSSNNIPVDDAPFVEFLIRILCTFESNADLLALAGDPSKSDSDFKKAGLTKKDRIMLTSIREVISVKAHLFFPNTPISTPLMIAHIFHMLPPSNLSPKHLPIILSSLRHAILNDGTSSLPANNDKRAEIIETLPFEGIYYHLRLLDAYLLGHWTSSLASAESSQSQSQNDAEEEAERAIATQQLNAAKDQWLATGLVTLLISLELAGKNAAAAHADDDDNLEDSFPVQKCLDIALRVLVSLTHTDEACSRKVLNSEYTVGFLLRTAYRTGKEVHIARAQSVDLGLLKQESKEDEDNSLSSPSSRAAQVKDVTKGSTNVKKEADPLSLDLSGPTRAKMAGHRDCASDEEEEDSANNDISASASTATHALDTLCLALGLLTNLVQRVDHAKDVIRETVLNPSCTLKKRACAKKCLCSPQFNGLQVLVQLYELQQIQFNVPIPLPDPTNLGEDRMAAIADSPEAQAEAEASFLRGHLAVLFGLLMMGSTKNQEVLLDALPPSSGRAAVSSSTSTTKGKAKEKAGSESKPSVNATTNAKTERRIKLAKLVEQAKDFVLFYAVVSDKLGDGEKESRVAKDVVGFLEALRDGGV